VRRRILDRIEGPVEVDGQRLLPLIDLQVLQRRPGSVDTRVRQHDVEPAPLLDQFLDGSLDFLRLGDIGDQPHRFPAVPHNAIHRLLRLFLIAPQHAHLHAMLRQQLRGCQPNA